MTPATRARVLTATSTPVIFLACLLLGYAAGTIHRTLLNRPPEAPPAPAPIIPAGVH